MTKRLFIDIEMLFLGTTKKLQTLHFLTTFSDFRKMPHAQSTNCNIQATSNDTDKENYKPIKIHHLKENRPVNEHRKAANRPDILIFRSTY